MKTRVKSAIIALIVLLPTIIIGGTIFDIVLTILACLGLKELINLKSKNISIFEKVLGYLIVIFIINYSVISSFFTFFNVLLIVLLLLFIPTIFTNKEVYNYDKASLILSNSLFIGITFYLLRYYRVEDIWVFIYLILLPILTDTFAYIGGKKFGKHKLLKRVSPNKTIEGALIGTAVSSIICSVVYLYYVDPSIFYFKALLFSIILSIMGQLGDLFFSQIKRTYNVKDFSNIMPGHGGILDRLDSTIFVFISFYLIQYFI